MSTVIELDADDTALLKSTIEAGHEIVYVTFGRKTSGAWRTAKLHLPSRELTALFLLPDVAALDRMGWTENRVDVQGNPLGNAAPKGVFFNRGGSQAIVLTGRRAQLSTWVIAGRLAALNAN